MVLTQYIKVVDFTSGERVVILTATRDIAMRLGLTDVVQHVEQALEHERMTREFDKRWAGQPAGRMYSQRVIELDNLTDPVLTSIRDIAVSHTKGLPANDELVVRVNEMLSELFPSGLAAVVTMSCVDQVGATEVIVDKLQTSYAPLATELGLTRRVAYLAELTVEYRAAVVNDRELGFPEVKAMRDQGQLALREIVAMILGQLADSRDQVKVAQRQELLEPLGFETNRVRKRRVRRRGRRSEVEGDNMDTGADDTDEDQTGAAEDDAEDASLAARGLAEEMDAPGELETDGEIHVSR
jgi:hypothetical protein